MLAFIFANGIESSFALNGTDAPASIPVFSPGVKIVALRADGAEKKMLAKAGVRFPRVHGPVTLPDQAALLVALNFAAIVDTYAKKPAPVAPVAHEGCDDDCAAGNCEEKWGSPDY